MIATNKIIDSIQQNYAISIINVIVVNRLLFRKSFIVTTDDGQKYIVKDYANLVSELDYICEYQWSLYESGLDIGIPIKNIKTKKYYTQLDSRYYVLFKYIEGSHPTHLNTKEIAECLRKYHSVAKLHSIHNLHSTKHKLYEAYDMFSNFYKSNYTIRNQIIACKDSIEKVIIQYPHDTKCDTIIHGDTIMKNMILTGNRICLIDFDNIRMGQPIEDVANTVLSIICNDSPEFKIYTDRYQNVRNFIDEYYCNNDKYNIENDILYYMKVHCIIDMARYAKNIEYLIRMPSMQAYLIFLVKIIKAPSLNILINLGVNNA